MCFSNTSDWKKNKNFIEIATQWVAVVKLLEKIDLKIKNVIWNNKGYFNNNKSGGRSSGATCRASALRMLT